MKKNMIFSGVFVALMCVFGIPAANAQSEEVEITEYCTLDQVQESDAVHGHGIGESRNQQQARSKARAAAIQELGENIMMNLKSFAKNFNESTTYNDDEEFIEVAKSFSQRIVNQNITNVKTICEKGTTYTNAKGVKVYKYYQLVEFDKEKVEKVVYDGLKEAGALKAEYDYKQFQEEFDKAFEDRPDGE